MEPATHIEAPRTASGSVAERIRPNSRVLMPTTNIVTAMHREQVGNGGIGSASEAGLGIDKSLSKFAGIEASKYILKWISKLT